MNDITQIIGLAIVIFCFIWTRKERGREMWWLTLALVVNNIIF